MIITANIVVVCASECNLYMMVFVCLCMFFAASLRFLYT